MDKIKALSTELKELENLLEQEKLPLIVSQDGVEIYDGDNVCIIFDRYDYRLITLDQYNRNHIGDFKVFYTFENAENWLKKTPFMAGDYVRFKDGHKTNWSSNSKKRCKKVLKVINDNSDYHGWLELEDEFMSDDVTPNHYNPDGLQLATKNEMNDEVILVTVDGIRVYPGHIRPLYSINVISEHLANWRINEIDDVIIAKNTNLFFDSWGLRNDFILKYFSLIKLTYDRFNSTRRICVDDVLYIVKKFEERQAL